MVTGIYFIVFTISFMGSGFPIKETGFPFGGNAFPGIGISVSMRERGKTCYGTLVFVKKVLACFILKVLLNVK